MKDRNSWAIGGGCMLGIGAGFFMLPNVFAFVGSIMVGIGLGLVAATLPCSASGSEAGD